MAIRRLLYQIDYVHILTFRDEYRKIIAPWFAFDNLRYAIENENTILESIRLFFQNETLAISVRKDGLTAVFEGNVGDLKNQNGVLRIFFDMYEKIKVIQGYSKTTRHFLIANSVVIKKKEEIENILKQNTLLGKNPFGPLDEFACVYEFVKDETTYKFHIGNYNEKDIVTQDLMPFKTGYNKDLVGGIGMIGRVELIELEKTPSFSKFKTLLAKAEETLEKFELIDHGK